MPSDPHMPLRDDVRLLGDLLGDTLRTQAGEKVFRAVEQVRALAKGARAGRDADFTALAAELSRMPVDDALPVARAFTHFLNLANIAGNTIAFGVVVPTSAILGPRRNEGRAPTDLRGCSPAA
jgi:phosphoenolpyruvate carboxylase